MPDWPSPSCLLRARSLTDAERVAAGTGAVAEAPARECHLGGCAANQFYQCMWLLLTHIPVGG